MLADRRHELIRRQRQIRRQGRVDARARHDDPIDNMFRPAADELAALFPGARTLATETVVGGTYFDALDRSWVRVVRSIGRAALPFYAPARWKNTVRHLPWLVRRFAATCAVLEKSRA